MNLKDIERVQTLASERADLDRRRRSYVGARAIKIGTVSGGGLYDVIEVYDEPSGAPGPALFVDLQGAVVAHLNSKIALIDEELAKLGVQP